MGKAENSTVYKVGRTTYRTSGKITSNNVSTMYNGYPISNMTTATYSSSGGDSGGIVYGKNNSKNIPAGIHHGRYNSDGIYTKAINVVNTLNVYPY